MNIKNVKESDIDLLVSISKTTFIDTCGAANIVQDTEEFLLGSDIQIDYIMEYKKVI